MSLNREETLDWTGKLQQETVVLSSDTAKLILATAKRRRNSSPSTNEAGGGRGVCFTRLAFLEGRHEVHCHRTGARPRHGAAQVHAWMYLPSRHSPGSVDGDAREGKWLHLKMLLVCVRVCPCLYMQSTHFQALTRNDCRLSVFGLSWVEFFLVVMS